MAPDGETVRRFAADLASLVEPDERLGIAVSGGPDSLALLLLAAAARPGSVEAATVDHKLRPDSRAEADMVAATCRRVGVPHAILTADAPPPRSNLQAWARELRYRLLSDWAAERGLAAIATGHHADDQAETLLMRLARGSGVAGLAGAQRKRLVGAVSLVRPLLGWRRSELAQIVAEAKLDPVSDPSNSDERFDRTRARALLESSECLDPARLAATADHCRDAEEALDWAAREASRTRRKSTGAATILDPAGLPRELQRRLLLSVVEELSGITPPGPKLAAALHTLDAGGVTTLCGLKLEGGSTWRLAPAPPRR